MAEFLRHSPCQKCGSSDARAEYSDGSSYCFSCSSYSKGNGEAETEETPVAMNLGLIEGQTTALTKRNIHAETCQKFGYKVGTYNGQPVQIADYRNREGRLVAQKLRFQNKDFMILGEASEMTLFGQHLFRDGGKMIVVTEGEIDCLSVSQVQGNKWPVVSIPTGATSACKAIRKQIDWLEKFEKVVFMFDNDEVGKKASKACASLLSPGKAKIATLPLKDANDLLMAGRGAEIVDAMWNAKEFRPDGIVGGAELWDYITKVDLQESVSYPYAGVSTMTHGIRKGELVTICAGSGIGKSQFCRELAHWLLRNGKTIGYIALEESVRRTALGILAIEASKPLHIKPDSISPNELQTLFDGTIRNRFFTYDHFGSMDSENLLNRVRYMARGCGCEYIVLDHLSIVVSGMGDGDERRLIDNTMTKLRSLVEELKIGLILVSHLKRPEGRGHEDGATTSLSQLRGSAGIAQLSDIVIGLERDQQADGNERNITTIRILKNRFTGETGISCRLEYNKETGRLKELAIPDSEVEVPEELE